MRIAIFTSGILPLPAVRGGAVETLLDDCLRYNDTRLHHDITVYSIADEKTASHPALQSACNHYRYIETKSLWSKAEKRFYRWLYGEGYYHYTIEYYFRKAWHMAQGKQYDLILIDNRPGYALRMNVPKETRLAIYLHNDILNDHTPKHENIYAKADRIITVSQYIANRVKTINANDKKTVVVHNGIDTEAFSPRIISHVSRAQLGLSEEDFVMVFSGRVNAEKGVAELIEAMNRLQDMPDIKLLIIGSPFYGDTANEDDFVKKLKEKAAKVKDRIRFTGFIPYAEMPQYLKLADVAVVPSQWNDPFPTTVLEAQAMGLPIIATRRGGIPEEVTSEGAILLDTGLMFACRLAEAVTLLYQSPARRAAMSKALLARSTYYNRQRYAEDFFKALE
jgi:glycosyltransferase involved in cell wall biosynthesis